jgi:SAM-dependent methyltransferase
MSSILDVWPTDTGLVYRVEGPGERVVDVDLDRRRVWSFRETDATVPDELRPEGVPSEQLRFQPWPTLLRQRLTGRFEVALRETGTQDGPAATVALDESDAPLQLADVYGRPLVVNKWGRLGHALGDAPDGLVDRMLDSMDRIRELLEQHLGPRVYVTGGSLLGPVREDGHVLPHDDDADLAYLSTHTHPLDVALESFEIGRLLRAAGHDVVRLSVGHLQVHVSHDGIPDHYVDVFPGFLFDGHWYQHFAIRAEADEDELLPPSTVMVEGREEPAPRRPERMLEELFGSGWRVPDPSYAFDIPAATGERFYGWFADYNVERELWEDVLLLRPPGATVRAPAQLSAFAAWVHRVAPAGSGVVDLGCGIGTDALGLAAEGRPVHALDFSRHAISAARERLAARGQENGSPLDVTFEVLNLLDTRAVIRLGAQLASQGRPWTLFGRRLLNALEDRGRENLFRLCSMLLRQGTAAHFDIVADQTYTAIPSYRHLTVAEVAEEAAGHGLALAEAVTGIEPMTWFDAPDEQLVTTCRMTFRRSTS